MGSEEIDLAELPFSNDNSSLHDTNVLDSTRGSINMVSPIMPYHFNTNIIPSKPEYIFQLDTSRSRPFTLRLTYITGSGYITGLALGGSWGIVEGCIALFRLQDASRKVRITAMLNSITRRGPLFGNNLGILSMYFAFSEQIIRRFRNNQDNLNKVFAAIFAGTLWRCTKSLRATVIAGFFGGIVVGCYHLFDDSI
ncbi:Mitochondrial import inner membrane translocase subunit tim23-like [Oopsacas minuta]|uniref:Mitochondrial import inner membrane translocase subunit tim23-like n=1 Tax=Oopsacas minuta TaxID=111878 RepID=A0AAV7KBY7_9METZ|nr:Mitochondrial import inner membrane translocase subunit tim23-like [Oopsacas minuta]